MKTIKVGLNRYGNHFVSSLPGESTYKKHTVHCHVGKGDVELCQWKLGMTDIVEEVSKAGVYEGILFVFTCLVAMDGEKVLYKMFEWDEETNKKGWDNRGGWVNCRDLM